MAGCRDTARTPDNDGVVLSGLIDSSFARNLRTHVDTDQLRTNLAAQGIVVDVASSPTGYVCNHTYFRILAEAAMRAAEAIVGWEGFRL